MTTIEAAQLFPELRANQQPTGSPSIEAADLFPEARASSSQATDSLKPPRDSAVESSPEPEHDHSFRGFVRRLSHSFTYKPNVADVDKLVEMGFPRRLAERQLAACHGNVQQAAELMVHAAHPPCPTEDMWNHPDCPICVREANNVRIANARRTSLGDVLARIRSRDTEEKPDENKLERRGSVGAMLRRPSISAALARMTSRDVTAPQHKEKKEHAPHGKAHDPHCTHDETPHEHPHSDVTDVPRADH